MGELGVDALLLSHGADLPWLTGYRAMPLERLTMLVLPVADDPCLVVPALEAPRVAVADDLFAVDPWSDGEDPIDAVASLLGAAAGGRSPASRPGRVRSGLGHYRCWRSSSASPCPMDRRRPASPRPSAPSRTRPRWRPCGWPVPPPTGWRRPCTVETCP